MARGRVAPVGETRTAPNGYQYTKTRRGWRLTHHIIAEKQLGRPLKENERVTFKDLDRTNFTPSNLEVKEKIVRSNRAKAAALRAKIADLEAQLEELNDEWKEDVISKLEND